MKIENLTGHHDRTNFASGSEALDRWLRETARQHQDRNISRVYVATLDEAPSRILGFHALTACQVVTEELPPALARRLPRTIPAVRLGRLAVDRSVQGCGLGALLLVDAMERARQAMQHVGLHALVVDAKDQQAAGFYAHFGFQALPDQPLVLVLRL